MGCLSVGIQRVGGLSVGTENLNGLEVGCAKVSGCEVGYAPISGLYTEAERHGGLKVDVFFVCKVGTREFVKVTPLEPLWIDVGFDGTYRIRSNTNWSVT